MRLQLHGINWWHCIFVMDIFVSNNGRFFLVSLSTQNQKNGCDIKKNRYDIGIISIILRLYRILCKERDEMRCVCFWNYTHVRDS